MAYEIKKDIIPGLPKNAFRNGVYEGVVAHSTATPEATAETEVNYFKREWNNRNAFVHFFVDWTSIIQTADTAYKAWGAGNGNSRFVHVELCETKDPVKFQESYKRYVFILAKVLKDKNLGVKSGVSLVSHAWVSQNLGGTDHMDPIDYLKSHGISWTQLVNDVTAAYNGGATNTAAKNGWSKEKSVWYYYRDGKKVVGWLEDKGEWYYLAPPNGAMVTGEQKIGGKTYYFLSNGKMAKTNEKGQIINV